MSEIHRYPRTRHLRGSRLQAGDADRVVAETDPASAAEGRYLEVGDPARGVALDRDERARASLLLAVPP